MREFSTHDDELIRRDVIASARPAVLRGLVKDWPIVAAGRESPAAVAEYLRRFDNGTPVDAIMMSPEFAGRIAYNEAMNGLQLRAQPAGDLRSRAAGAALRGIRQSAVARRAERTDPRLPAGIYGSNSLSLLDESVLPRIWLGNAIVTPTHLDEWHNIGCVAAGRRRFTLFPPEQIANLYIGPIDFAPTGAPMSLVTLHDAGFQALPEVSRRAGVGRHGRPRLRAMPSSSRRCGGITSSRSSPSICS